MVDHEVKKNKTYVELHIADFECSHDEIANILSITPTEIWHKNDNIGNSIRKYNNNGLSIMGTLDKDATLMEWIDNVIAIVEPNIDKFALLPQGVYIELSCCVYMYEGVPAIYLEKRHINFLHGINAEFDLDMYIMPSAI